MKKQIEIDGAIVRINPKAMKVNKIYFFSYFNERYGAYKNDDNVVVILRET